MQQVHPIPPVFDADSTVLVLGSFPSVKSRESGFFYGHAQNRFWRVTAAVFGCPVPVTIPEKRAFLLQNHVALWDVIASCDIDGSSDASIKNVRPNDLAPLLAASKITHICRRAIHTLAVPCDRHFRRASALDQPRQCRVVAGSAD